MAARLLWASRAASYLRISTSHRAFSTVIKDLKYADTHEWVRVDGTSATVGITDHAQDHLGDVVYVELPEVGTVVSQGKNFGAVESVKATSDVNSPVSGEIVEVNSELSGSPGLMAIQRVGFNKNRLNAVYALVLLANRAPKSYAFNSGRQMAVQRLGFNKNHVNAVF